MTKKRLWLATALMTASAIGVGVQLTLSGIRFFHERRMEQLARKWFVEAQEAAKPGWSEDDAARWLEERCIEPYRGEQSGSGGHYYVVEGCRKIEDGGMITRPASVFITFLFGPDHKFVRAEYKMWLFEPPGSKRRQ